MMHASDIPPESLESEIAARDLALIVRLRDGDAAAHDALITLYGAALIRFAARIVGSFDRAEEVVQELFLKLWQEREAIVITRDVAAYLFWLARNRSIHAFHADRTASNRDRVWTAAWVTDTPVSTNSGALALEIAEHRARIFDVLATVPPRCREVFMLVWDEQLPYADIARMLGISIPTVRNQMSRALKRLAEVLRPELLEP